MFECHKIAVVSGVFVGVRLIFRRAPTSIAKLSPSPHRPAAPAVASAARVLLLRLRLCIPLRLRLRLLLLLLLLLLLVGLLLLDDNCHDDDDCDPDDSVQTLVFAIFVASGEAQDGSKLYES